MSDIDNIESDEPPIDIDVMERLLSISMGPPSSTKQKLLNIKVLSSEVRSQALQELIPRIWVEYGELLFSCIPHFSYQKSQLGSPPIRITYCTPHFSYPKSQLGSPPIRITYCTPHFCYPKSQLGSPPIRITYCTPHFCYPKSQLGSTPIRIT